ncbi:MAG TPA: urease accessory UreF family protein [Myxococcales bacterium]|nr:urease accessory UreF family protein [Myxococcales bacterium]
MTISWLMLQISDSALPAGGFAHSAGLEAAAQQGEVHGAAELRRFVHESLWQAGHFGIPLASAAHADAAALPRLDARADAFLVSRVANRASRTQGRAFLDTTARIFPAQVTGLRDSTRAASLCLHHAPIFGAVCGTLGLARDDVQQLWLSTTIRGVLFAGVRLGLVGTHEAQRMQHELAPAMDEVLAACGALSEEEIAQTSPLLDLLGSTHDRLYSRLFQS